MFPKVVVSNDAKPDVVKDDVKSVVIEIDVGQHFRNEQVFSAHEHMLEWVCMEARKLGFDIVIKRPDNGSNRRKPFVTMRCERSGMYVPPICKLKRDDT